MRLHAVDRRSTASRSGHPAPPFSAEPAGHSQSRIVKEKGIRSRGNDLLRSPAGRQHDRARMAPEQRRQILQALPDDPASMAQWFEAIRENMGTTLAPLGAGGITLPDAPIIIADADNCLTVSRDIGGPYMTVCYYKPNGKIYVSCEIEDTNVEFPLAHPPPTVSAADKAMYHDLVRQAAVRSFNYL